MERLTNLVLFLLEANRPLTLSELTDAVGGYPEVGEARRRSFERDKSLLRQEGVPIKSVPLDGPEQSGYVIAKDEYYLPELGLTEEEQVALNLAASAVRWEGGAGADVALKLGLFREDNQAPAVFLESVPWLAELEAASRRRSVVRFDYRSKAREVEPYGIASKAGHWYLVGKDRSRNALRRFRVDRIETEPSFGDPGGFERPPEIDIARELPGAPWELGEGEPLEATVAVSSLVASEVAAEVGEAGVPGESGEVVFRILVSDRDAFRSWMLGWGHHGRVLGPPELVAEMVAWLESWPVASGGAEPDGDG